MTRPNTLIRSFLSWAMERRQRVGAQLLPPLRPLHESGYEPLPSSIIAEGDDIWNGAGDRGDAAMIAYGAARYRALARGSRAEAEELWPLIEWCSGILPAQTYGGRSSPDTDEDWRGVSRPARPIFAPRRFITTHCCQPYRSAASSV